VAVRGLKFIVTSHGVRCCLDQLCLTLSTDESVYIRHLNPLWVKLKSTVFGALTGLRSRDLLARGIRVNGWVRLELRRPVAKC